jgi:MFS family permease
VLLRNLRTFDSLKSPHFRLYFVNNILGQAAMHMQALARPLLVYEVTGSTAMLGISAVVGSIPLILLSPIGGTLADRFKKKYIVLCGQMWSVVLAATLAILLTLGYLEQGHPASWWILVGACLLDGVGAGLAGPSFQAMVREIVGADKVMNAMSLNSLGMNVLRIVVPLVTGLLIEAYSFTVVFYIMAGIILLGTVFIGLIPATAPQLTHGTAKQAWADIAAGFRYIKNEPSLFLVLLLLLIVVLLSMPLGVLMPVFADDVLKVGADGLGKLQSAAGIGATIISVILASMPNKRRGMILLVASFFVGITMALFSFSSFWYLSLVAIFFMGIADTIRMTLGNTLLLYYARHEYWGRVVSVQAMIFGLSGIGALLASLMAEKVNVQWVTGGFAVALIVVSVALTAFTPRLRKLD